MLQALNLAHKGMQPVIDAIIELAEKAGKEPFEFTPPDHSALKRQDRSISSAPTSAPPTRSPRRTSATRAVGALRDKAKAALGKCDANPDGADANVSEGSLQGSRKRHRPHAASSRKRAASMAAPSIRCARSNAWSASCRARTVRRCSPAVKRKPIVVATLGTGEDEQFIDALCGTYQRALHAPLQLPSLQRR